MKTTKPLKIIFDATPLISDKSGVGYYTFGLITALSRLEPGKVELTGYYFNFLGRKLPKNLPMAPNIIYKQIKHVPGKVLNGLRRLGLQLPLEFLVMRGADIALFPNFVSLPVIGKTKRAVVIYDLCFLDCPEYVADKNLSFLQRWVPKSIKQSDLVVTISEFTKRRIKESFSLDNARIHVTHIPPLSKVAPDNSIIEKYNIGSGYFLFVGTIEPRKNILGLVNGYAKLPKKTRERIPLVLAGGKGWHDKEILRRIEVLRNSGLNIILTGYVTDAERAALYDKALLCLQPSHYEGFGMPVLEAMSYGKPVACSDIEVLHEVAGEAAIYFDKDSPSSIAGVMSQVAANPLVLAAYAERSRSKVATFPTWDNVAKDLYTILSKLK